jgi:hypothetical protein
MIARDVFREINLTARPVTAGPYGRNMASAAYLRLILASGLLLSAAAGAQQTQPSAPAANAQNGDEDEIVVTGRPPRGSVIGDIPPEIVLHSRDVRATGATTFDELLEAIAPDIGAARASGNGTPLVLLNGHRVSSYRELRDIPIEAVTRVDILPEEVALKYGYPPDQMVVNVVLLTRFT